jgi:hypothetical protein
LLLISGHAIRRMHVGISSALGAVLPACKIARLMSVSQISGTERVTLGTVEAPKGTSSASVAFWCKFSIKTDLLLAGETAGGCFGKRGATEVPC